MNKPNQASAERWVARPSGLTDEHGRDICFVGAPPLALNPATNALLGVRRHNRHPLLQRRYYYTLPADVLEPLIQGLGDASFDPTLLEMERELTHAVGDHTSRVGIWNSQWILFQDLREKMLPAPDDDIIRSYGMEPVAASNAIQRHNERDIVPLQRFRRGFLGWLVTNREFLAEQDALLAKHAPVVQRLGTAGASLIPPSAHHHWQSSANAFQEDPHSEGFNSDCQEFLVRWRLAGLAGPDLPLPLPVLMAGQFSFGALERLAKTGGVFYLPDTMPVLSRDQLRGVIDDALHRGEKPAHLAEWYTIVRTGNPDRTKMERFARLFELQHYWRLLHERHARAIHGKIATLEEILGVIFGRSQQTIHADLIEIRKRLGTDWLDRGFPL